LIQIQFHVDEVQWQSKFDDKDDECDGHKKSDGCSDMEDVMDQESD
jgi:hypothetical protein